MDADKSRPVRRRPADGGRQRASVRRPRKLARPELPAGPQRDVRDLLYNLHEKAGRPALEDLERRIAGDDRLDGAPKKDLIHRIISRGGPAALDNVRAVARILAQACGQDEYAVAARVTQLMGNASEPPPSPPTPRSRLGHPVGEYDPLALEVHPAIHLPHEREERLDRLPEYVLRTHDTELRQRVDQLLAGASSQLIALVGESSTGKTRACWELAQYVDERQSDRWRLWHPYDPTRPDAALADLRNVGPFTIIWLNEAQHYLMPADTGLGERIAAGIRTLLHHPQRRPVLVLATLWPQYWDALTVRPDAGLPDPYAQARDLLTGTRVSVADGFTAGELAELRHTGVDPRLRLAAVHAEGGRITQYLAGAPELEDRYHTAPPTARAIIQVAIDARRLGHPLAIPRDLLEQAAAGYIDEHDWDAAGEDWLNQALTYTARACKGARGPLTRIRPRHGQPDEPRQSRYRLADYLEQSGRHERTAQYPPESLWTAFAATVSDPVLLLSLGQQAQNRGRYQHAIWLYNLAAARGSADALSALARLRDQTEDTAEAEALYQQAADRGSTRALRQLAGLRENAGDAASAKSLYQRAADLGDTSAIRELAWRREQAGDFASAEALAVQAADLGDTDALVMLAGRRERAGDTAGAEALYQQAADRGDTGTPQALVEQRARAGDAAGAEALAVQAADRGDPDALQALAKLRERTGETASAEALYRQAADCGDTSALRALARLREKAGDTAGAETLYRQAADRGNTLALRELALLREQVGDTSGAELLYRQGADRGDGFTLWELAGLRYRLGDSAGADQIQRFGLTGSGEVATGLDFGTWAPGQ